MNLGIIYGLLSAVLWGAGDFAGGYSSKSVRTHSVIMASHIIGGALMVFMAIIVGDAFPGWKNMLWGMLAGVLGLAGVLALYKGLSIGRMSVVAPIAGVVTAVVPVVFGIFIEGLPAPIVGVGFVIAGVAVWFISAGDSAGGVGRTDLIYGGVAGLGFGLLFIFLDQIDDGIVYWPLVGLRLASFTTVFVISKLRPAQGASLSGASKKTWFFVVMTGLFDVAGNIFFTLGAQAGRLDTASVLASMYPASTVFLAWVVLREKLSSRQWLGVALAFLAVWLIAG